MIHLNFSKEGKTPFLLFLVIYYAILKSGNGFLLPSLSSSTFLQNERLSLASSPKWDKQRIRSLNKRMEGNNRDSMKALCRLRMATVELPNGTSAEVLSSNPTELTKNQQQSKPTLVFIHGSFHAAWCWEENYFDYFSKLGYDCFALSLRGTGGTFAGENVRKVKILEHVSDLEAFLEYIHTDNDEPKGKQLKPVLIAHSFGGLAVMKYLEKMHPNQSPSDLLSGVTMFCSVPPSGNGPMTLRYLTRSLRDSWKITAGFAMKKCLKDSDLCRSLFFSTNDDPTGGISNDDISRYQSYFDRDTAATIDLSDLAKQLPSARSNKDGSAPFIDNTKQCPALVVGACDDFIVDIEGVDETAKYFNVLPTIVDSPHDVMLGPKWESGAAVLSHWLDDIVNSIESES